MYKTKKFNHVSVLIIDDEEGIRSTMKEILSLYGYDVITAKESLEGLKLLETNPVDLVMTDFKMPGMHFSHVAAKIKDHYPEVKIVLVTGWSGDMTVENNYIDGLISKPFKMDTFINTIQKVL